MIELLGDFPRHLVTSPGAGKFASEYFNRKGVLRNINVLNYWGLREVLSDKYKFCIEDATAASDFLLRILQVSLPTATSLIHLTMRALSLLLCVLSCTRTYCRS
jgi:hypothetical protein